MKMRANEDMVNKAAKVIGEFCPELSKGTCLLFATKVLDVALEEYDNKLQECQAEIGILEEELYRNQAYFGKC